MGKRLVCFLLALCLLFSLCACSHSDDAAPPNDDKTVYVSRSGGKIHRYNDCSGMKYYDTMTYGEAIDDGYTVCEKCFS